MRYKLAVFDMDGTILNTLEDLTDSLNAALRLSGYPQRTIEEVRNFVGNGIRLLIERGVPQGTEITAIDKVHRDFMEYYQKHCADKTRPYDGIVELMQSLRQKGCKMAVVSNKADSAVKELSDRYFPGIFDISVGERQGILKKPAPDSVNEVLKQLQVAKEEAVYIGDSDVDIATARNVKMDCISVVWGFRKEEFLREQGAVVFARTPEDILQIIQNGMIK